jgi:hypothetical protein
MKKLLVCLIGILITSCGMFYPPVSEYLANNLGNLSEKIVYFPLFLCTFISLFIGNKKEEDDSKKEIEYFKVVIGGSEVYKKAIVKEKTYYLGKNNNCDLKLNFPFIDDYHLHIRKMKTYIYVNVTTDKAVHLNRQRLKKEVSTEVYLGDTIQIGKIKIIFC